MLLPGIGLAQSTTATEVEEIPRYDVEIIIFKNVKAPKSKEFILPVSSPGKGEKFFDISSAGSVARTISPGISTNSTHWKCSAETITPVCSTIVGLSAAISPWPNTIPNRPPPSDSGIDSMRMMAITVVRPAPSARMTAISCRRSLMTPIFLHQEKEVRL